VKISEARTGRLLCSLEGPHPWVRSLAFSPDGKRLVVASDERLDEGRANKIAFHDATTGKEVSRLYESSTVGDLLGLGTCKQVAFSPDGKQLAIVMWGAVVLWDVPGGKKIHTFRGSIRAFERACFRPDGRRLAVVGKGVLPGTFTLEADRPILKVWNTGTGKEEAAFLLDTEVHDLAYHPQEDRLALGCDDGTVQFWSTTVLQGLGQESAEKLPPLVLKHLLGGGEFLRGFFAREPGTLHAHEGPTQGVAFTPAGCCEGVGRAERAATLVAALPEPACLLQS
jgi:WD40 repeat protein